MNEEKERILRRSKVKRAGWERKGSDRTITTLLSQQKCHIKVRLDWFLKVLIGECGERREKCIPTTLI